MSSYRLTIVSILIFSFLSCSKKDNAPPDTINYLLNGTWQVTGYIYNTENRTGDLSDYTFTFNSDKKITAVKQDTSITGTWHADYTPRQGNGLFDPGGELYIEFKFSSDAAAFVDISKRWKPYITVNDASLLTFDHGIGLSLIKN